MKAALFSTGRYAGPAPHEQWPASGADYAAEVAEKSMNATLEQFRLADEVGFHWVSVAEHHYAPLSLTPNPMVFAGALTQVVKKARIALLGPDVPILNPVRVAEEFAMLDTMSGGRVIAGMMRGTPNEYVTYNINPSESRARFEEALELIKMAWTRTEPFGWQGRHYEYRTISLWPKPVQRPHPPIYMSGSSPESGTYAARNRYGIGFAFTTVQQAAEAAKHYRAEAERFGWTPTPDEVIYRAMIHVADTDEEAFDDLAPMAKAGRRVGVSMANLNVEGAVADSGYYGTDREGQRGRLVMTGDLKERVDKGQVIVGGPETVAKQIRALNKDLGAGVLDLVVGSPSADKAMKAVELIGAKILPAIEDD